MKKQRSWAPWLPLFLGIAVATASVALWQGLREREEIYTEQMAQHLAVDRANGPREEMDSHLQGLVQVVETFNLVDEAALVGGLVLAAMLGLTVHLAQAARRRAAEVEAANLELEEDIAARSQAEEEVRRLNAELEQRVRTRTAELEAANLELRLSSQITTNMAEGVYLIQASNGAIVYANPRFEVMFGYGPGELIGQHVSIVNAPGAKPPEETAREIMEALSEKGVWNGEVENVKKDGTSFWCSASVSTFEHAAYGTVWLSVHQDVTERKQAEEAVRRLNEDLERRAMELQAANRELEAFSYTVSHDLRAPLRAIDGFSRILMEDCAPQLTAGARRYLHLVRDNTQQMGHLVDDLLAFSRLSRQAVGRQLVAPAELVRQALEDLRAEQEGRRVELAVGDLPACQADPALLKQVFVNLLSNALKFSRGRERTVIEVGCRQERGEWVYFVKDNGVGFDPQYAGKLFGVFQRLHRSEEYEGTGVGLAIVERIVHRHGGRVWAEAEVDQGATFQFTLAGGTSHAR